MLKQALKSRSGKLLIGIWLLAFACLVLLQVPGLIFSDLFFSFYLGFIPLFLCHNLAILVSLHVGRGTEKITRLVWVVQTVIFLGFLFSIKGTSSAPGAGLEMGILMFYVMAVASFPASILVILVGVGFGMMASWIGLARETPNSITLFGAWMAYFVAGYLQWFWVLPAAVNRWRRKRAPTS